MKSRDRRGKVKKGPESCGLVTALPDQNGSHGSVQEGCLVSQDERFHPSWFEVDVIFLVVFQTSINGSICIFKLNGYARLLCSLGSISQSVGLLERACSGQRPTQVKRLSSGWRDGGMFTPLRPFVLLCVASHQSD